METLELDLMPYDTDIITDACEEWRKQTRKLPHPSDMIPICERRTLEKAQAALPKPPPPRPVPRERTPDWYEGKFWAQFELYEREQFIKDLRNLPFGLRKVVCRTYHAPETLAFNIEEEGEE